MLGCLKLLCLFVMFGLQLSLFSANLLQGFGNQFDLAFQFVPLFGYFSKLRLVLFDLLPQCLGLLTGGFEVRFIILLILIRLFLGIPQLGFENLFFVVQFLDGLFVPEQLISQIPLLIQ